MAGPGGIDPGAAAAGVGGGFAAGGIADRAGHAQHRYNASVGEGVTEAKILEPLQKEIDQRTAEIKRGRRSWRSIRGDVKVEVGLSKLIESLRSKILAELKDVAAAMAPVDKQLSSLNDSAAPLPQAQQKQAWEFGRSLAVLDDVAAICPGDRGRAISRRP